MSNLNLNTFPINSIISFSVYPVAIIGTKYQRVKLVGMLDFESASMYKDIRPIHANIFSTLPAGTVDDPTNCMYWKVIMANGAVDIVGDPWIDPTTIVLETNADYTFSFTNMSPNDRNLAINALSAVGITPTAVTTTG